jgi:gamma-glutamyltranspeptidase/glutathione hydrolase
MAVAPHSLAAESAIHVLRDGGNALEAMISAAATIAVVYPHMNSIGGDGFWVINGPGGQVGGIDASGASGLKATKNWFLDRGVHDKIPFRGGVAALTVAGTISGWGAAHELSRKHLGGRMPLSRLLSDAIFLAQQGSPVTASQAASTKAKLAELKDIPGFAETFLVNGRPPEAGSLFKQPRLAKTLQRIAKEGTETFYRGQLSKLMAQELAKVGSPLAAIDLNRHQAHRVDPLTTRVGIRSERAGRQAQLFNMVPPSQGVLSLMILGIMDRLEGWHQGPESAEFVHAQVEATKAAFRIRDAHLTDRTFMKRAPSSLLEPALLDQLAAEISMQRAAPWGGKSKPGDTIWMGVTDAQGIAVSFIQSIYHEFGSGIVLPESGVNWQNRGCSFSLDPAHINTLAPGKKPFHTLNAGLAQCASGTSMVYGSMGGDGQPQTQATIFSRVMQFSDHPQQAIERPRWLLGRTWGAASDTLKLESRFAPEVFNALRGLGHQVEEFGPWDESFGHAGMIVRHANGVLEGGYDPRSNGAAIGF